MRAGTISESDLKRIKAVDKVRKEQRRQTVDDSLDDYQSLLLGGSGQKSVYDSASKRQDVVQYMLTLTGDLLNGSCTGSTTGARKLMAYHRLPLSRC